MHHRLLAPPPTRPVPEDQYPIFDQAMADDATPDEDGSDGLEPGTPPQRCHVRRGKEVVELHLSL